MNRYCFVLMPFGVKPDGSGRTIDFDNVYNSILKPTIVKAGLDPIRADQEGVGGSIHKPMFERLMICEFAVADLTTSNANVFYELGIRHAFRPHSTMITFHTGSVLPFDVAPLRGLPYRMDAVDESVAALSSRMIENLSPIDDSPIFQMVSGVPPLPHDLIKADVFRDHVETGERLKERLARARMLGKQGREEMIAIRNEMGDLRTAQPDLIVELFKSLKASAARRDMVALFEQLPLSLQQTRFLREQYAAQLNELAADDPTYRSKAERILREIIDKQGASSETNGLLGRVYKDQYVARQAAGDKFGARGFLDQAIDSYVQGFENDWRDPYPGVNAVTLMELQATPDARQAKLLPVVRYAAERRAFGPGGGYWDHATLLEIAVLECDTKAVDSHLLKVLTLARQSDTREISMPQSTARNLRLIMDARASRGDKQAWLADIIAELDKVAAELAQGG